MGAERKLVVLILGGDGKGQDFEPLAAQCARYRPRPPILIGRDGPKIAEAALQGMRRHHSLPWAMTRMTTTNRSCRYCRWPTLEMAVSIAANMAQRAGDAVLMSPACASFDMFRNYPHRAEVFRAAVQALADETGAMLDGGEA